LTEQINEMPSGGMSYFDKIIIQLDDGQIQLNVIRWAAVYKVIKKQFVCCNFVFYTWVWKWFLHCTAWWETV